MMDPQESRPTEKTTIVEWVLCSPNFEDIVIITEDLNNTPHDLDNTPITSQFKEISAKQIWKRYFEAEFPRMSQAKRRNMKQPIGK